MYGRKAPGGGDAMGWRQWVLQALIVLTVLGLMTAYWYATQTRG
ncbi:hypothetical protein [Streptomyces subrutilus]|nr:hypothetical protein [Streptomyces subrutilus]